MTQVHPLSPIPGSSDPSSTAYMNELTTGYTLRGGTVTPKTLTVDEDVAISAKANTSDVATSLAGKVSHSLATAQNDVLVGAPTPFGSWVKKTLAEFKTILGLVLTQAALATGFTLSGGTTSKTLTVENTSLVNQDLTTDASPTFAGMTVGGTGAPTTKYLKLTGTTNAAEGGETNIAHGLTSSKIRAMTAIVNTASAFAGVPPEFTAIAGYQYSFRFDATNIIITNHATNSENVLGKTVTVIITYAP